MDIKIALLPGDGVGPEVVQAATQVLDTVAAKFGHTIAYTEGAFGLAAIERTGDPFPEATRQICEDADAVLLGAVGGYAGATKPGAPRPEAGLLALRKHFGLFANLRPVKVWPGLQQYTPLKPELLDGVDILFVRELTGGIYFGERQELAGEIDPASTEIAYDTLSYSPCEVSRIAEVAFQAAQGRDKRVVSVDKANVLAASRLWRQTVDIVAQNYPEIALEHHLVDSFAIRLITQPAAWDVVVTGNMFGDILSDAASVLAGSLGMLPSAALNDSNFGVYEPVHGSAPDIAGQGIANPIGTILSAALLLRHSLGLATEADAIETAVEAALAAGARSADITEDRQNALGTAEMSTAIIQQL
jgi:3-isopropylmalate dehydrogenase